MSAANPTPTFTQSTASSSVYYTLLNTVDPNVLPPESTVESFVYVTFDQTATEWAGIIEVLEDVNGNLKLAVGYQVQPGTSIPLLGLAARSSQPAIKHSVYFVVKLASGKTVDDVNLSAQVQVRGSRFNTVDYLVVVDGLKKAGGLPIPLTINTLAYVYTQDGQALTMNKQPIAPVATGEVSDTDVENAVKQDLGAKVAGVYIGLPGAEFNASETTSAVVVTVQ